MHGSEIPRFLFKPGEKIVSGSDKEKKDDNRQRNDSDPLRVRLPGFISDEEVGLGDVIKRATYAVGFTPCSGCEQRAAALNRWIIFTK